MRRLFEVNSEPHTGARRSVRLCVGLIIFDLEIWKIAFVVIARSSLDRNLALYLPRLAVLVSIEADRPGAWFPGQLGPYAAFPALSRQLSRDFICAKVPGNPMNSPFLFWRLLGGHI